MSSPNLIDLREHLAGLDFPASKEDLIRRAQETGATTEVLEALRSLPADRVNSPEELGAIIGEHT